MLDYNPHRLGLGTHTLTGEEGIGMMAAAIDACYYHPDMARLYGDVREVAEPIERVSVDLNELFVAIKIAQF